MKKIVLCVLFLTIFTGRVFSEETFTARITSFETEKVFYSKDINTKNGHKTCEYYDIIFDGKNIGQAKITSINDVKATFLQISGEKINSTKKYNLKFSENQNPMGIINEMPEMPETNCLGCGKKTTKYRLVKGKAYCEKCIREKLEICWVCNGWVNKNTGVYLYTNFFICKPCASTQIDSDVFVRGLYQKVQDILWREMGIQIVCDPSIEVKKLASGILGLYSLNSGDITVNKQAFLDLLGTIAHEHAHAWVHKNNPYIKNNNLIVHEGFACWVEYHFYNHLGQSSYGQTAINSTPSVYQQGFDLFMTVENKYGRDGVMKAIVNYREEEDED